MAHHWESGFVVREAAWHGLATVLKDAPTIAEGIKQAGLEWDVVQCPIEAIIAGDNVGRLSSPQRPGDPKEYHVPAPGWIANVRSTDKSILGIVSEKYKPIQNKDAFQFFDKFLDNKSCALEAAGSLKSGRFVWVLAKIANGEAEVSPGDKIYSYLKLSTAHDGSHAGTIAFTPIRVVCYNTLSSALAQADKSVAAGEGRAMHVLHVGDVKASLAAAQAEIDIAHRRIGKIVQQAKAFKKVEMDKAFFYRFLEEIYGPERAEMRKKLQILYPVVNDEKRPQAERDVAKEEAMVIEEKLARPVRRSGIIHSLVRGFETGPGAEMAGQTLWGAINAVTHYEEHQRVGSNEERLYASWFGGNTEKVRERAFEVAASLV